MFTVGLMVFFSILLGPPPQEFALEGVPISVLMAQLKEGDQEAPTKIIAGRKAVIPHFTRAIMASGGKGKEFYFLVLGVRSLGSADAAACVPVLLFVRNPQNAKLVDQVVDMIRKNQ